MKKKEGEVRQELAAPMTGRQREKTTHLEIQTAVAFIKDLIEKFLFIYIYFRGGRRAEGGILSKCAHVIMIQN